MGLGHEEGEEFSKYRGMFFELARKLSIYCWSRHQNAGQNHDMKTLRKCGTVQIFGNDSNKSKFDSGEN
jgi:hypothetical protein